MQCASVIAMEAAMDAPVERDTANIVERTRVGTFKLKNSVDHLSFLLKQLPGGEFDPVGAAASRWAWVLTLT